MSVLNNRSYVPRRVFPAGRPARRAESIRTPSCDGVFIRESFDQSDFTTTLGPDLTWWKNGDTVSGVGPDDGWTLDGQLTLYGGTTPGNFVANNFPGQYGVSSDGGGDSPPNPLPTGYSTRVLLGGVGGPGSNRILGPIDPTTGLPQARAGYVFCQPDTPVGCDSMFTEMTIASVPPVPDSTNKNHHIGLSYHAFCRCSDFSAGDFDRLYLTIAGDTGVGSVGPFTRTWTASIGYAVGGGSVGNVASSSISAPTAGTRMRVQLVDSVLSGWIDNVQVLSSDLSSLGATWTTIRTTFGTYAGLNIQYSPQLFNFGSATNGGPWPGWPGGTATGFSGTFTGEIAVDDFVAGPRLA